MSKSRIAFGIVILLILGALAMTVMRNQNTSPVRAADSGYQIKVP